MADPNIKTIQLTGGTTEGGGKSRRAAKKQSVNKTYKIGGGATSTGTLTQLQTSRVTPGTEVAGLPSPVGVDSSLTAAGAPVGGAAAKADIKVVLAAPKKKAAKLILKAAKHSSSTAAAAAAAAKTRKVSHSKKVRVTISSLSKKIHQAKDIRKKATDSTIAEVRKALEKAGLVKVGSKAPDTMLRQLYADYMTLKGRAL
jgi:hypothetical protein